MLVRNLISVIIPAALSLLASFLLNTLPRAHSEDAPFGVIFFSILFFILNLVYSFYAASKTFTQLLMGGIVIKLLLAMIVVLVYSLINNRGLFAFSVHFLTDYILFTIFEIRYLLHLIKTNPTQS